MQTIVVGPKPWQEIRRALRTRGPRHGAVAYLGSDAPDLLIGLRKGDELVVNASRDAITCGATSPYAIQILMERGVAVSTSPTLHAKILTTSSVAVIGSANASAHSMHCEEASIISTQPSVVRSSRELVVDLIAGANLVTEDMVQAWKQLFGTRRNGAPVPGVTGSPAEMQLLPDVVRAVWVVTTVPDDMTASQHAAATGAIVQDPKFPIESMQMPDGDEGFGEEDVVLRISLDGKRLLPPVVVYSPLTRIPNRDEGNYQLIRGQRGMRSYQLSKAVGQLDPHAADVVEQATEDGQVRVTRKTTIRSLLRLWGLEI